MEPSILRSDGKSRSLVFYHIHRRRGSTKEVIYLLTDILIGFEMHSSSQLYQQLYLLLTPCLSSCPQKFGDIGSLMQVNNLSMSIQVLLLKPETSRTYQLLWYQHSWSKTKIPSLVFGSEKVRMKLQHEGQHFWHYRYWSYSANPPTRENIKGQVQFYQIQMTENTDNKLVHVFRLSGRMNERRQAKGMKVDL